MRTSFISFLAALLVVGCQTSTPSHPQSGAAAQTVTGPFTYSGGDGLSIEQAVIITGVSDNMAGIKAEYAWLREHYPGFKRTRQRMRADKGRIYDQLDIVTSDGQTLSVFFDITCFLGKLD